MTWTIELSDRARRELRLRVGDWRVHLVFNYGMHTIEVMRVLPRGRAYRD